MSNSLDANPTEALASATAARYQALSPAAVASLSVAPFSILTALWWPLAIIPLTGIALGWHAQRYIRRTPDEWTGLKLARAGIAVSAVLWVLGYGWLIFAHSSEVPYGYQWVTYEMLQPDPNTPTQPIPQTALDMQDRKVFIQGYMQPRRRQTGIKEFILCPSNGECSFCIPNPKRTEMIRVVLQGDMETFYTTHQIGVAGRLRVDVNDPSGVPYSLDAEKLQ